MDFSHNDEATSLSLLERAGLQMERAAIVRTTRMLVSSGWLRASRSDVSEDGLSRLLVQIVFLYGLAKQALGDEISPGG
jgi:hypothetical protein